MYKLQRPTIISGGFPCQDVSAAGRGDGLEGTRSRLWFKMFGIIRDLRPEFAVIENSPMLNIRGLWRVLGNLASIGYDAEWTIISAADVGADHLRERMWIVAYPNRIGGEAGLPKEGPGGEGEAAEFNNDGETIPYSDSDGQQQSEGLGAKVRRRVGNSGQEMADTGRERGQSRDSGEMVINQTVRQHSELLNKSSSARCSIPSAEGQRLQTRRNQGISEPNKKQGETISECDRSHAGLWLPEPSLGRVVDGFSGRVDEIKGLGAAVVPQIPEIIGHRLVALLNARS